LAAKAICDPWGERKKKEGKKWLRMAEKHQSQIQTRIIITNANTKHTHSKKKNNNNNNK
jgi:hypothetical protein